ncbi:MAG TPA: PEP-CTERM sorting domain-containing protein, partial [Burkholderiales bacterium]|nr:PEP-CTERM sorting domain-containing protein [Burkholderiales bacterium]
QQRGDPTWHLVTPLTLGAYRVMGVLVPEPSTLALGFAAMLAGALRVLRKALRAGSTARSVVMCGVAAAA